MGKELVIERAIDNFKIASEEGEEEEQVVVEGLSAEELVEYARYGEVAILEELIRLDLRERLQAVDNRGNTMLHMFAANGHLDCIRYLVQHTPNLVALLDHPNKEGNTALHWACIAGQLGAIQLLILNGAKCTIENNVERTPICEAHRQGRTEVLAFFEELLGRKPTSDDPADKFTEMEKVSISDAEK